MCQLVFQVNEGVVFLSKKKGKDSQLGIWPYAVGTTQISSIRKTQQVGGSMVICIHTDPRGPAIFAISQEKELMTVGFEHA